MGKKNQKKGSKHAQTIAVTKKKVDWWPPVLLILAGLLVFYPPLLAGLFFDKQMFISHILTSLVFALVLVDRVRRKDYMVWRNPLDWAIAAYAGAYLLALAAAVHQGEAIYGFLRALNYFMVYWVVSRAAASYRQVREILKFLLAGGTVVAVIGILAAAGYSNYPGAYTGGQIMSTLQYSNTMAAYLAVLILVGITLALQEKSLWLKMVYGLANLLMAMAVLGAISKGAWLILAGGAVLLLIGMPNIYRIKSLYYMGLALGAALVVYGPFAEAIANQLPSQGLNYVGLGVLLTLAGVLVWEGLEMIWRRQCLAPVVITALFAAMAVIGIFYAGSQVLPSSQIANEISTLFDTQGSSYSARLEFMRCAVEMAQDHPLVGTGAGGWEALYRQYQNYAFWTTETHSHFLQVWVEAGTLGLLAFLSFWVILIFYLYRIYKAKRKETESPQWILSWGIASACLALGAHSAIDFDLSIPAVAMVLWSLLALLNSLFHEIGPTPPSTMRRSPYAWIQIGVAGLLVVILLVSGSRYLYAINQASLGEKAMLEFSKESNPRQRIELLNRASISYNRAIGSDRCNGQYRTSLSTVYTQFFMLLKQQDLPQVNDIHRLAVLNIDQAGRLDPYNIKGLTILLNNAARLGHSDGIIRLGQQSVQASPNDINVYKNTANLWWDASQKYLEAGQKDTSLEFARQIQLLENSLLEHMEIVEVDHPHWQGPRLQVAPELNKVFEEAGAYLKENS